MAGRSTHPSRPTPDPFRVLVLIDSLTRTGGAEQSLAAAAPAMAAHGVELVVAHLDPADDLAGRIRASGVRVVRIGGRGGRLVAVLRVAHLVRKARPDLIHTKLHAADLVGRLAGRLTRVPVVSSVVNTSSGLSGRSTRWGRTKGAIGLAIARHTARWVVRYTAVSAAAQHAAHERLAVPLGLIDVVPNGRELGAYPPRSTERRMAARRALGCTVDTPIVLAVGRHIAAKGFDVLLHAVPSMLVERPDLQLLVAGAESDSTPLLRALITAGGLERHVRLLGHRHDLLELHQAADVYVLSSRAEGLPGALLDAMAMATPAVVTDIGPAVEAVGDESALVVPVDDPAALAAAVLATLDEPAAAAVRAATARRAFEQRYTIEPTARGLAEFYRRAASSSTSAAI